VPGIWECRPDCETILKRDDAVILAIQHPHGTEAANA
jgi:hypothetical protein